MLTVNPSNVTLLAKNNPACDKFKLLVSIPILDLSNGAVLNPAGTYNVSQFSFSTKSIRTPQNYGAIWRSMICEYKTNSSDLLIIQIEETGATFFIGSSLFNLIGSDDVDVFINWQFPILVPGDFTLLITNYKNVESTHDDSATIYLTNEQLDPIMNQAVISGGIL